MCHELAHRASLNRNSAPLVCVERETNVANTFPSHRDEISLSLSLSLSSLFSFSNTAPQLDFSSSISMNRRPILWKERILPTLGAIYPVLASISQDLKRLNAFLRPPSQTPTRFRIYFAKDTKDAIDLTIETSIGQRQLLPDN